MSEFNEYSGAYPYLRERAHVWREIARYVQRDAPDARVAVELGPGSVDLVFASNFLEHLDHSEALELLSAARKALSDQGRLILLQPKHNRCADHYFDDPTHKTIFDDQSIGQWLGRCGLRPTRIVQGLLPFSMKSRLPQWPLLVRRYLNSPIRPMAAQMYVVAEPA